MTPLLPSRVATSVDAGVCDTDPSPVSQTCSYRPYTPTLVDCFAAWAAEWDGDDTDLQPQESTPNQ